MCSFKFPVLIYKKKVKLVFLFPDNKARTFQCFIKIGGQHKSFKTVFPKLAEHGVHFQRSAEKVFQGVSKQNEIISKNKVDESSRVAKYLFLYTQLKRVCDLNKTSWGTAAEKGWATLRALKQ